MSSFKAGLVVLQSDLGPKTLDWNWISNNLSDEIIPAVIGHVYLSFVSVAIALAISLPPACWSHATARPTRPSRS